mgnify:CR=1 FL=1
MIFVGIGSNLSSEAFGNPMKNCIEAVKILNNEISIEIEDLIRGNISDFHS